MSTAMRSSARPARSGGPRVVADAPTAGGHTPGQHGENVDAWRYLLSYNATNAGKVATEITRATGAAWVDAVQRIGRPFDALRRTVLWWSTMADRSEPRWHLPNEVVLSTAFAALRDFTEERHRADDIVPTIVLPPQAGHSSTVVDYSPQQSQIAMIRASGLTRVYALEWKPATAASKDVGIDDYLTVIDRSIRRMGGVANVVGDCQGGWLAAIYAAQHPERVNTLTLAGAPIDFQAGDSVIAATTRITAGTLGMAPYRALVALGGGNVPGRAVLSNFIGIQPQSEVSRQLQLLENIDDATHVERYRVFEDWFKHTQDIPGAFYLWLVENLFWKNELVTGELEIGGRRVDMGAITCPVLLLAGSTDHITPPPQMFAAADVVGTPASDITTRTATGGHLGLFMGRDALRHDWPPLMETVYAHSGPSARAGGGGKASRRRNSVRAVADPRDTPRVPAP